MDGSTPTRRKKSIGISTEKIGFVVTQICDIARLSRDDSAAITVRLARLQPSRLCGAARKELGAPFGATCGCNGVFGADGKLNAAKSHALAGPKVVI